MEQGSWKWAYIYFPTAIPILLQRSLSFGGIGLDSYSLIISLLVSLVNPCSADIRFLHGGRF